jgi:hypothetical protein
MEGARLSGARFVRRVRTVAAAGNAAALVLLILVLANHGLLFGSPGGPPPEVVASRSGAAIDGPVLLVVVDGLRLDGSLDPKLMPSLRQGARGTARVEALVPSTVAGIRTLAEGVVPPPGSFFGDFGTSRSSRGGIFEVARKAGVATFVAGPGLWSDLYGPWLTDSLSVESVTGRDRQVLQAGLAALRSRRYGLIVVHLNGPDDAAHLSGARSESYRRALASADEALGRLMEAAGPRATVVVTADHGVADPGGHAGPEEEVLAVPLVVQGPVSPRDLGVVPQREIHRFVLEPLGLELLPAVQTGRSGPLPFLVTALGVLGSLAVGSVLLRGIESPRAATWLNAGLWVALALALAGREVPALIVAFAALAASAFQKRDLTALGLCAVATTAGAAGGALRLLDGTSPVPPGWRLPVALLVGIAGGALSGKWIERHPLLAGVAVALLPALVARLAGETASLSTLDVRLAFQIVDGPSGLIGAALVAALRQALPAISVILGLAPSLARADLRKTTGFTTGLAAALTGQALAASLALLIAPGALPLASRSVGLLVRLIGEMSALFLGCAAVTIRGSARARFLRFLRRGRMHSNSWRARNART